MKGELVLYPNDILRCKCRMVKVINEEVLGLVEKLKKILGETEISAGLAAPQLGYDFRIFGIKHCNCERGENCKDFKVYINPRLVSGKAGKDYLFLEREEGLREAFLEGCLSFPDLFGMVKRWKEIEVEYEVVGSRGDLVKRKNRLDGFEAVVFQHELDHLDGVLFVDHVKRENGEFYRQKKGKMVRAEVNEILELEN